MTVHGKLRDLAGHAQDRCQSLLARTAKLLPFRALRRFAAINGNNRMIILASQAFTALVPLLLVIASIATHAEGNNRLASDLVRRFRLNGQAAVALETLFHRPPDTAEGFGVLSIALLLFSVLSLARTLQSTFEAAWGLPISGLRGILYGTCGTALFVLELAAATLIASLLRRAPRPRPGSRS